MNRSERKSVSLSLDLNTALIIGTVNIVTQPEYQYRVRIRSDQASAAAASLSVIPFLSVNADAAAAARSEQAFKANHETRKNNFLLNFTNFFVWVTITGISYPNNITFAQCDQIRFEIFVCRCKSLLFVWKLFASQKEYNVNYV